MKYFAIGLAIFIAYCFVVNFFNQAYFGFIIKYFLPINNTYNSTSNNLTFLVEITPSESIIITVKRARMFCLNYEKIEILNQKILLPTFSLTLPASKGFCLLPTYFYDYNIKILNIIIVLIPILLAIIDIFKYLKKQ